MVEFIGWVAIIFIVLMIIGYWIERNENAQRVSSHRKILKKDNEKDFVGVEIGTTTLYDLKKYGLLWREDNNGYSINNKFLSYDALPAIWNYFAFDTNGKLEIYSITYCKNPMSTALLSESLNAHYSLNSFSSFVKQFEYFLDNPKQTWIDFPQTIKAIVMDNGSKAAFIELDDNYSICITITYSSLMPVHIKHKERVLKNNFIGSIISDKSF
ncbi:hypothetical protein BA917_08425 [Helicobacter pullorum]|uniref:hypothetical protein n=1 Tax=Helicobacter pullorum TaxID=35818 RepID=UPI00081695A2|nr:hypothetical protein [Helicobacter pullorum]OCR18665.1 hypothetical protein BA917_08425 [Helicobacter pullorum]